MQEASSLGLLALPHNLKPAPNYTLIVNHNQLAQDSAVDIGPLAEAADDWGWFVIKADGHDWESIGNAYHRAILNPVRPKMIIFHTVKGKGGDPAKEGKLGNHGKPPANEAEVAAYLAGAEAGKK